MIRLFSTVVLAGLLPAPALAAEPSAAEPATTEAASSGADIQERINAIEAHYSKVDTIQANFVQKKKDAFGAVTQEGDIVLKRPTKMRWRFTSGDEQMFVTDGKTLWIYTKADNQVMRITDTSQATSTANTFLTSLDSLDELFDIKLLSEEEGQTFELTPKKSGMYKKIELSLDDELALKRVVFTDEYGNVTDLSFDKVVENGPVDEKVFTFVPPEGAKVIDN